MPKLKGQRDNWTAIVSDFCLVFQRAYPSWPCFEGEAFGTLERMSIGLAEIHGLGWLLETYFLA